MKPWKAVTIICILGFIVLVIAFALGGVGVEKNESTSTSTTATTVTKSSKNALKGYGSKPEKLEESSSSSSSSTSSSEKSNSSEKSSSSSEKQETEVKTESDTSALPEVNFPTIKSEGKSTAVVSAKHVYKRDKTIVFSLELTLPTEEMGTVTVEYFTSGVNYNTVKVGDLLTVEYGVSSDGAVALAVVNTL